MSLLDRPARRQSHGVGQMPTVVAGKDVPLYLTDVTALLLRLVAQHDGLSEHGFISRAVVARAEEIGLGPLLDAQSSGSPADLARAPP